MMRQLSKSKRRGAGFHPTLGRHLLGCCLLWKGVSAKAPQRLQGRGRVRGRFFAKHSEGRQFLWASPAVLPEKSIAVFSELPKLKVMSRNSVFHYKGKEVDAQM